VSYESRKPCVQADENQDSGQLLGPIIYIAWYRSAGVTTSCLLLPALIIMALASLCAAVCNATWLSHRWPCL
jgi:hypothetical protein